jgi:branched-subunit amino acid aminotransferase/4-amino-4-deoxychorismate lyase
MNGPQVCWVDGRLRSREEAAVRVDDLAFSEGRGCYTSVRISRGRNAPSSHTGRSLETGRSFEGGAPERATQRWSIATYAVLGLPV